MCGIAGIVLRGSAPIDGAILRAMTSRLVHRGPDGEGHFLAPGVGLGHRRLSIVDLSDAAAQPMLRPTRSGSGTDALTFNGEIYDFASVRHDLETEGEHFVSSGDTEVLLHVLQRYGPKGLSKIHGMFAFGFWNAAQRELVLARDRFGK